tara:strand:+ start:146 stop:457 length:312 start_codon:yes stop_codon:yes gene_type:complete
MTTVKSDSEIMIEKIRSYSLARVPLFDVFVTILIGICIGYFWMSIQTPPYNALMFHFLIVVATFFVFVFGIIYTTLYHKNDTGYKKYLNIYSCCQSGNSPKTS